MNFQKQLSSQFNVMSVPQNVRSISLSLKKANRQSQQVKFEIV